MVHNFYFSAQERKDLHELEAFQNQSNLISKEISEYIMAYAYDSSTWDAEARETRQVFATQYDF